jgi:hypothetical protein
MAQVRIYHWKHGWIPLDHAAALSKAKGNHAAATRYLAGSHAAGHAHESVVTGSYGGGTHVRGMQPVAAEHLPRERHITAAFNPETRRFALLDTSPQRVGLGPMVDHTPRTTSIPEHLAEHLHARGHRIQSVKKNSDGTDRILVETKTGGLKLFKADGSDIHAVDPIVVDPPAHTSEHAVTDHRDEYHETHTIHPSSSGSTRAIIRPVNRLGGADVISGALGEHITSNGHKVIGYSRRVVTTVDEHGVVRRFKADGSNMHKPVIAKKISDFKRQDIAGWTHTPAHEAIPQDNSVGGHINAVKVKRAYVKGNKRVLIETDLTNAQTEAFLGHVDKAFALTQKQTGHAITIHVPTGDRVFGRRGGFVGGYVYRGDSTRVHINPAHARGEHAEQTSHGGHFSDAARNVHPALYALVHELGHTTDFKNGHTHETTSFTANGQVHNHPSVKSSEHTFYRDNLGDVSRYGKTKAVEAYAESFAQYHLRGQGPGGLDAAGNNKAADNYAARYKWS